MTHFNLIFIMTWNWYSCLLEQQDNIIWSQTNTACLQSGRPYRIHVLGSRILVSWLRHCVVPAGLPVTLLQASAHWVTFGFGSSVAWDRKWTIPTERQQLVGEVSACFCGWCRVVSAVDPYGRNLGFLDRRRYFFLSSSSSVVLTRLSGPRSRPTSSQKMW
jgi:hypothetical protein